MKYTLLISTLLILCGLPAAARVGETQAEVDARYGAGQKSGNRVKAEGAQSWTYSKAGFVIEVEFIDGKSVCEVLHGEDKMISDNDIRALLKLYDSPSVTWRFDKKQGRWERGGKPKLIAYRWPGHPDFFVIKDVEVCDAAEKKARAAEKKDEADPRKL